MWFTFIIFQIMLYKGKELLTVQWVKCYPYGFIWEGQTSVWLQYFCSMSTGGTECVYFCFHLFTPEIIYFHVPNASLKCSFTINYPKEECNRGTFRSFCWRVIDALSTFGRVILSLSCSHSSFNSSHIPFFTRRPTQHRGSYTPQWNVW